MEEVFDCSKHLKETEKFIKKIETDYTRDYLKSILDRILTKGFSPYHVLEGLDDTTLMQYVFAKTVLNYHNTGYLDFGK